jgi:hypothetical protein
MNNVSYRENLYRTFSAYRKSAFPDGDELFEARADDGKGPTVFKAEHADRNVLIPPNATSAIADTIYESISRGDRHTWFASLGSSQALCQSVFGGLRETGHIKALEGILAEDGNLAFFDRADDVTLELEHKINTLNEPRPTSIDAYFSGSRRVAVEVKLGETEFGTCSRPRLKITDPNYERDHCDGTFTIQRGRSERCSLTSQKIAYWQFVPRLLNWSGDTDLRPCPLAGTYQLVRNLLAACVNADDTLEVDRAHVIVVYDNRNPAFATGGQALAQWSSTTRALRFPRMVRKVSWQRVVRHLATVPDLRWLVEELHVKYGIIGEAPAAA